MRDPELMFQLLKEMAAKDSGQILIVVGFENSKTSMPRRHNARLLSDTGLAEWVDDHVIRITNAGHDFVEAVDKKQGAWEKFIEILETGAPLLNAINSVADIFNKSTAIVTAQV